MLLHFLLSNILIPYLSIGIVVTISIDIVIRVLQSSEPFTVSDVCVCTLLWPSTLVEFIKGYING